MSSQQEKRALCPCVSKEVKERQLEDLLQRQTEVGWEPTSIGVSFSQSHQSMRIMDQTLSGLFGYVEASILFLDMDRNDLPK